MLSSHYQRLLRITAWIASTGVMMSVVATASIEIQSDLKRSWPYASNEMLRQLSSQEIEDRLEKEPLHAPALRNLSLIRPDRTRSLFLAHKTTRRDPLTQLLLVEHAARERDVSGALKHYNVLLATSPNLRDKIIDVLGRSGSDRNVFRQLAHYSQSSWYTAVLFSVVDEAERNSDLVALLKEHPEVTKLLRASGNTEQLAKFLIQKQDPENAFLLFPEASIKGKEATAFAFVGSRGSQPAAVFNWRFGRDIRLVEDERGKSRLEVDAAPNTNTFIAQRYTDLNEGAYRLTGILDAGSAVEMRLRIGGECVSTQKRLAIPNDPIVPSGPERPFQLALVIPSNCAVQRWNISLIGDDARKSELVKLYGLQFTRN